MKQIVIIVKPFLAEKVIHRIIDFPLDEICIREVKGFGYQKNYLDQYGDNEYARVYVPKVEITVWIDDGQVDSLLAAITETARTGRPGDGKIMVLPVGQTGDGETVDERLRTG